MSLDLTALQKACFSLEEAVAVNATVTPQLFAAE